MAVPEAIVTKEKGPMENTDEAVLEMVKSGRGQRSAVAWMQTPLDPARVESFRASMERVIAEQIREMGVPAAALTPPKPTIVARYVNTTRSPSVPQIGWVDYEKLADPDPFELYPWTKTVWSGGREDIGGTTREAWKKCAEEVQALNEYSRRDREIERNMKSLEKLFESKAPLHVFGEPDSEEGIRLCRFCKGVTALSTAAGEPCPARSSLSPSPVTPVQSRATAFGGVWNLRGGR